MKDRIDVPENGDAQAGLPTFDQVFNDNAACVFRILRWLGVPEPDVEDVCQEVFILVDQKLASHDGRCSLRTWLYGFCRRKASEYRRSRRVQREELVAVPPEESEPASQDVELDRRAMCRMLDRILDSMDDDKRFVYVMYEIEQVPMDEVAALAGCPVQTAYSRHRAATQHIEAAVTRLQRYAAWTSAPRKMLPTPTLS